MLCGQGPGRRPATNSHTVHDTAGGRRPATNDTAGGRTRITLPARSTTHHTLPDARAERFSFLNRPGFMVLSLIHI